MPVDLFIKLVIASVIAFAVVFLYKVLTPDVAANERDLIEKHRSQLMRSLKASQQSHQDLIKSYYFSPITTEILSVLWTGQFGSTLPEEILIFNDSVSAQFHGLQNTYVFQHHRVEPLEKVQNIPGCIYNYSSAYRVKFTGAQSCELINPNQYETYLIRPQVALAEAINRIIYSKHDIKYEIIDSPKSNQHYHYEEGYVTMRLTPTRHL